MWFCNGPRLDSRSRPWVYRECPCPGYTQRLDTVWHLRFYVLAVRLSVMGL